MKLACLLLLLASPALCLDGFEDLDEALKAVRARRSIRGRVSASVGKDAVDEVAEANGRRLRALARIAQEGDQTAGLAKALLERFNEAPDGDAVVLQLLDRIPVSTLDPLADKLPTLTRILREQVVSRQGRLPRPLARLYVRYVPSRRVGTRLEEWVSAETVPAGFDALLAALPRARKPVELFTALVAIQVPPAQEARWIGGLSTLVYAHDAVLEATVGLLDRPETRQRARLLGALGNAPHDHDEAHGPGHAKAHAKLRARVDKHVTHAIREGGGEEKARAITSAARLGLHALLDDILRAAGDQDASVQTAAIAALPDMLKQSIPHLRDPKDEHPDPKVMRARIKALVLRVNTTAERALRTTSGTAQVAALLTARRLRLRKALREVVLPLATNARAPSANRLAALRCFGGVMPRNAETVDALLKLMEGKNRVVAQGAWRALQTVARTRLPFRMELWRSWRERVKLPN